MPVDFGENPVDVYQRTLANAQQAQGNQITLAQRHLQAMGDVLNGVTPENYASRRQMAINSGLAKPEDIPQQYDPQFIQNIQGTHQQMAQQIADLTSKTSANSAANVYGTQVLSGVVASGDQGQYDMARQKLQASGIDVSQYAPDVATAQKQLSAAKLAQSPFGALLGAAGKMDSNNMTASIAGGAVPQDPNAMAMKLLSGGGMPQPSQNIAPPSNAQPVQSNSIPAQPNPTNIQVQNGNFAQGAPIKDPSETLDAFKARQAAYQASPAYKTSETAATKAGDAIGDSAKTLNIMDSNLPAVISRLQEMRTASQNASSGMGVNAEGGGFYPAIARTQANMGLGSTTNDANAILQQKAAQAILPEIAPQLNGIKPNKFLENLANKSSGVDLAQTPEAKVKVLDGLQEQYVNMMKSNAQQLRNNGQPAMSDDDIDAKVAALMKGQPPQTNGISTVPDNQVPQEIVAQQNVKALAKMNPVQVLAQARQAIAQGKDRNAVIQQLRDLKIPTGDL